MIYEIETFKNFLYIKSLKPICQVKIYKKLGLTH